jgi:ribonuclease HI
MIRTNADGSMKTREMSQAFDDEEAAKQRNVAGEIMGAKTAIDFCLRQGIPEVEIYHDYEGVGKWADGLWKANNPLTQGYRDFIADARKEMDIRFVKVKAHAGNKYNEIADSLAKKALSE